jgi:hypothetical protein
MKQDILQEAANIFDSAEKWRAFYDMEQASLSIINHWLTIGAKALRDEFQKKTGQWECSIWGNSPRDTKWHLSKLGEKSIAIGIAWETFEFHLFDGRYNDEKWQKAADLLDGPDFRQLVSRIGPRCYRKDWKNEKLLLADLNFDPLGSGADPLFRSRLIAWHAAHRTGDFVEKTLGWVRRFIMEDKEMVRLIRELNERSCTAINA